MRQTIQRHDRWLKMPMAEYIVSYRDSARVRGYCRECGRYGNCWACPPYDFDETALLEQYTTISLLATVITPSEGVTLTPETADRIIRREKWNVTPQCRHTPLAPSSPEPACSARRSIAPAVNACPAATPKASAPPSRLSAST